MSTSHPARPIHWSCRTMSMKSITCFQLNGVMYYVDPYGNHLGYEDVFTKIDLRRAHFEKVGLGADYVERFIR